MLVTTRRNRAAKVGLALSAVNAAGSVVWWVRHGVRWVASDSLWVFPGPWQWAAACLLLAVGSGVFLGWAWRNAARGGGDDTKVFGGILLTVASLLPLVIQLVRYVLLVMLVVMAIFVVRLFIAFFSGRRFGW